MIFSHSILAAVIAIGAASDVFAFPVPTASARHQNGMPVDFSHNGDVTVLDTPLSSNHARRTVEVVRENFNARDLDVIVKANTEGDWRHHAPTSNEEEFEGKKESPHNVDSEILPVSVHISSIVGMTQTLEDPTHSLPSQYPHNLIRGLKATALISKRAERTISVEFFEAVYAFNVLKCNWEKILNETDPGKEIKRGGRVLRDTWRRYLEGACSTQQQQLTIKRHTRAVP
ncbi:hypothetical protein EV368DRAFT_67788 [Lentinula lateritia]|uniref:Uncharacterized protein n=1 Tax=Lentinula aff. lateritia TaxID=2804960 RepID=A0ACC1TMS4_9AGAR|nr:hypothetical protein F5876DRAFT_69283 [Lentinula aff. lateritia]KAJ3849008.1 hypothetical protein EV368DRAFT_67788 [Lentinula lateritia]